MKIEIMNENWGIPSFSGHFSEFEQKVFRSLKISFPTYPQYRSIRRPNSIQLWPKMTNNIEAIHIFCYCNIVTNPYDTKKNSWIKFCWTYPGFKGRSVIRPSSFRYKAIWWPYNGTWPYNGQKSLWPYKSRSSRFFKTPKGLVSDKRPWPYNRGNTVWIFLKIH